MSSVSIVRDTRTLIQNNLLPAVSSKWIPQFQFGLEAFCLRPFQSAGSNARTVVTNTNTAASKTLRLLGNLKLAEHLGTVCDTLGLVCRGSFINIDHSDQDGLTALVGAVQTRNGRAIPVMVETTYAHHIPADGSSLSTPRWKKLRAAMTAARKIQSFTGHTIDALQSLADRLGFWPNLVFDRGFANESILTHLHAEGAIFYVRLKARRYVELDDGNTVTKLSVKDLKQKDSTIRLFGLTLRVIRTTKSRRHPEPWFILTNDMKRSKTKITRIYYHRFEIEETFKDVKHLFELKQAQFDKPNSLKALLWFIALGIALLYVATKATMHQEHYRNNKKRRSWIRIAYEQFQRELNGYRALTGLAPRLESS
jgi:hypothetical protein